MLTIFLLSLFTISILYYCVQYDRKWRKEFGQLRNIPGPRNFPLIGNAWKMMLVPILGEYLKGVDTNLV